MSGERLEAERKQCRRVNQVEALWEEAEGAVLELRSVLDATRAELDEAHDDAEGVSLANDLRLQKFSVKASLRRLSDQVKHPREKAFRLLFELNVVRAERDEAIGRATATKEELIAFGSKIEALHARDTNHDTNEAVREEALMLQEWVVILSSRDSKLLVESETVWAEVARLWTELNMSRVDLEHFQAASS
ncbi:hypothetical protein ACLOJK_039232 [Asimina triloba]